MYERTHAEVDEPFLSTSLLGPAWGTISASSSLGSSNDARLLRPGIGFRGWGWTPSRGCRRGVSLAGTALCARKALSAARCCLVRGRKAVVCPLTWEECPSQARVKCRVPCPALRTPSASCHSKLHARAVDLQYPLCVIAHVAAGAYYLPTRRWYLTACVVPRTIPLAHVPNITPPRVHYWIAGYVETYSTVRHTMTTLFLSVGFVVACHTSQLIQFASCSTENKHNNKREDELGWHTQPFAAALTVTLPRL
ncbi:hypothetical protein V8E53_003791 [Lactarius tabidus]